MRTDQRRWTDIKRERRTCREAALRLFCTAPAEDVELGLKTLAQSWFPPEVIARAIQERESLLVATVPASGPIESAMARAGQDLDLVLDYNPWIARAWQSIRRMPQTIRPFWGPVIQVGRQILNGLAGAMGQSSASRARRAGTAGRSARKRSGPSRQSKREAGGLRSPASSRAVEPRRRKPVRPP